jgi:UDP-N-acetylmuramoyl-tripeptide--D-alanyl-D-alanine ligase
MFTLNDILHSNQGSITLIGSEGLVGEVLFSTAQHDSRCCGTGDLYVALKGSHADGHSFIPDVARAGALAALCTTPHPDVPPGFYQLVVPDVIAALRATAHARVLRQPMTTKIGVTGSSGKTTTKDAIAAVLSTVAPTLKTFSSYNTEIGYPLTLLRLAPEDRYAVVEMGAEYVGELKALCETIARPDWSVITTVGAAHLKYFGSIERIAIAKSELVQALSPDGIAFLNYDDPAVYAMTEKTKARVITYGRGEGATVRGCELRGDALFGYRFLLQIEHQQIDVQLCLPGEHGVTTALAAAAVGYAAGVPLAQIREALQSLVPSEGRGRVKIAGGPNGSTLIDDTYNSIRQAVISVTRAMRATTLPPDGKRWAVLGELLEQGEFSQQEHYETGKALAGNVDCLVAIGDDARYFVEGAVHAGMPASQTYYFPVDIDNAADVERGKQAVVELLKQQVTEHDLVLIKGSHGMHMETLIAMLASI